jgi:hypothetical protein
MLRSISVAAASMFLAGSAAAAPRQGKSAGHSTGDAKAMACGGISDYDLRSGPFSNTGEITSVTPLIVQDSPRTTPPQDRTVGAVVTLRADRGVTAEWLQRLVNCEIARNSELRGTVAQVRSTGDGFAIEMRSNERDTALEILAMAQRQEQQGRRLARSSALQGAPATSPREPRH